MSTRACSPPERSPTRHVELLLRKRNRWAQAVTWTRLVLIDHRVALGARARAERLRRVELLRGAARRDDAQPVGAIDPAGVRRELAGDQAQERGLAAAVGADEAERRARATGQGRGR